MNCLEIKDISKSYSLGGKKQAPILKNINFQVRQGDMVAVMGPSGSGKTTLLNIISGIDRPDSGCICIDGQDLSALTKAETAVFRRRRLGMVFQDFNMIESLTVRENVLLPMILDKRFAEEQEEQAAKILKILGIEEIQMKAITDISGGEKQRTAIGRALINNPAIILADEPTGNLDSKATRDVMRHFAHIHQETGTSILMVTHDTVAASYCNRVVLLKDGKFAAEIEKTGNKKEFLDSIADMLALIGGDQDDDL